jgi:hypothetical protein
MEVKALPSSSKIIYGQSISEPSVSNMAENYLMGRVQPEIMYDFAYIFI